jgi:hypothetical protein
VADIAVTDDALGANVMSLSGTDASSFEIRTNSTTGGKELWFKGGANFEAKTSYAVRVAVDDGGVGGTPDASTDLTLAITNVNEAPTVVALSNTLTSTAENGGFVKVADIAVTDDALGTNELSLTGVDASAFEIRTSTSGKELWFKGGANYEAKASYAVTVAVDDSSVGSTPDASTNLTLAISNVNEAPTAVALANPVTSTAENGSSVKVADIAVTDDAMGTNALSLAGADASSFELRTNSGTGGKELWFTGGANYEAKAAYAVTVAVDDQAVGATPDASTNFTLAITNVNEAPTAVVLSNTVTSTAENGGATKVANIAVTDDALGTNELSLAGADASSFEIRTNSSTGGKELWFKGGADYETKASYAVTVAVDDRGVGTTPDASANFALAITNTFDSPTVVAIHDVVPIGSMDPSGLAYVPQLETLFVSDSEVNESPFNRPNNLWALGTDGSLKQSFSLWYPTGYTDEPTGLAFDPQTGHMFVSDDDHFRVFWVDPANPTVKLGEFRTDTIGGYDPEDIAINPNDSHVFIVNGVPHSGGPCTIVETTNTGALVSTLTLPTVITDAEALAYDAREDVFYVSGGFSYRIWKVDRGGTILNTIETLGSYRNPVSGTRVHVKDMEIAPSSDPNDNPAHLSLYVADYGNSHVDDGRLFEMNLGDLMLV